MHKIFKYEISITDKFTLNLPKNWIFLSLQMQNNVPFMWLLIDENDSLIQSNFSIYGTGQPIEEIELNLRFYYLGTFQKDNFVWHLFNKYEEIENEQGKSIQ